MNPANLQLSPEEMRLVTDASWILTKNSIMSKAVGIMSDLTDRYREIWSATAAPNATSPNAPTPNATSPNAAAPTATSPNTTSPNAT
ncbi:MAG TPA: hypothetical protein VG605_11935, partial [Puia sp.]|nr:hypothetical protein [Puia sp.]